MALTQPPPIYLKTILRTDRPDREDCLFRVRQEKDTFLPRPRLLRSDSRQEIGRRRNQSEQERSRKVFVTCEGHRYYRTTSGQREANETDGGIKAIVKEAMRTDDETTAIQLRALLNAKGYSLSLSTILQCRKSLGWTFRFSAYCQMIREENKTKRLEWVTQHCNDAADKNGFLDVIFTDETSVQLESHRQFY